MAGCKQTPARRAALPRRAALALSIILALLAVRGVQAAELQVFNLLDFQFENGAILSDLRIGYETSGTLSPSRDNAILLIHGTSNNRHAFDAVIGPGKTFDTDRYFVITADAIGGGDSSSPRDDGLGQDFPRYTMRDIANAFHALVTKQFGIPALRALYGTSMGAFVGLEWGIHYPDAAKGLILAVPTERADANFRLTIDIMAATIALDPEWQGGRYNTHNPIEGLRHAGAGYYPWVVSAPYLARISAKELASELETAARRFAEWDANSLVWRYAASREHDVAAPFGGDLKKALAQVTAATLVLPSASDRLLDLAGARRLRDGITNAAYAEIPSDRGHSAARAVPESSEWDFIDRQVRDFLGRLK